MGSKSAETPSRDAHWLFRHRSFRVHCLPSTITRALNRIALQVDLSYEPAAPSTSTMSTGGSASA